MEFTDEMLWLLATVRGERCPRHLFDGGLGPLCLLAWHHDGPHAWTWKDDDGNPTIIRRSDWT